MVECVLSLYTWGSCLYVMPFFIMGIACEVYTRLMQQLGYGYPLWEPEPTHSGEVLVGDVGYIQDGGFYRLFNATLPGEGQDVPCGYVPLKISKFLKQRRERALNQGPICSKTVTAVDASASL